MASISKATHYKLICDIKSILSTLPTANEGKDNLQANVILMEQNFDDYSKALSNLHVLINKYASLERLVKVELRRRQLRKLKQKMPVVLPTGNA